MDYRFLRFPGGASTAPTTGNEPDLQILMRLPCNLPKQVDISGERKYNSRVKRYPVIITLFAFFIVFLAMVSAKIIAYRMTLTVITDKAEEFILEAELDEREFSAIKNDPNQGIQTFLVQARKEYADKIGYRKEIYGEENYKMVVIRKYSFVIRTIGQDYIILKKN